MFDDIKKAINIIHDLPQEIKNITTELYALSEIKKELNIQKEKIDYNEKLIDNIQKNLKAYFTDAKNYSSELTKASYSHQKCLEDFKASADVREKNKEAFRSKITENISDIRSSLENILNEQGTLMDDVINITQKQDALIDGIEKNNNQLSSCIKTTCNIESLINNVLSMKLDENNKYINNNISITNSAIKTYSESMITVTDILIKIREEMQSMDNSARLILLASVVSELDKSIKTDY